MGYWKKDAQRCPNLERVPWLDHQMWIQSAYFKYAVSYSIQYTAYIQYNYSIYDLGLSEHGLLISINSVIMAISNMGTK